jgi:hypothetical protein
MSIVQITPTIPASDIAGFVAAVYNSDLDVAPDPSTGISAFLSSKNSGTVPAEVKYHSVSSPFTVTVERPKFLKTLGNLLNAVTGIYGKVPENVYRIRTRKGVMIAANNVPRIMYVETTIRVPAGSDVYDIPNIRAALGVHFGLCHAEANHISPAVLNGTV